MAAKVPPKPFVYAITDRRLACGQRIEEIISALCRAGVGMIQLREKGLTTRELHLLVAEAVGAARAGGALLVVNDRPDVALYARADGVHLGDEDLPAGAARRLLGPDAIVGVSCHSPEGVRAAADLDVDYIAVGPVFPTETKKLRFPIVGIELVRQARRITSKPLVAIGGIDHGNASDVIGAGADGVAVISALMAPGEIEERARSLARAIGGEVK